MLNNVQLLRAWSAYMVVGYHTMEFIDWNATGHWIPDTDMGSGIITIFFAISGFLMVQITPQHETFSWFMAKRAARIVPLYWLSLTLVLISTALVSWSFSSANLSLPSILSAYGFLPWPDANGNLLPILGVGWTLNYEILFYILFGVAMMLPQKWQMIGLFSMMGAVMLGARIFAGDNFYGRFYGDTVMFDFAAGAALAHFVNWKPVTAFIKRTSMLSFALVAGILWFVIEFTVPYSAAPTQWRYWIPAMMIMFAAVGQDLHRKPTPKSFLTYLGDAGYSTYLLHLFILMAVGPIWFRIFGTDLLSSVMLLPAMLAITLVVSIISYEYFEKPTNNGLRALFKKMVRKKSRLPRPAAGMAAPAP
jgi:exopolysaccharide production protein ExoZ